MTQKRGMTDPVGDLNDHDSKDFGEKSLDLMR